MPCIQENPKEVDVALQILDVEKPRLGVSHGLDPAIVRETTQTDHLNKRLLTTFLERLNVMTEIPTTTNNDLVENNDNSQEFED